MVNEPSENMLSIMKKSGVNDLVLLLFLNVYRVSAVMYRAASSLARGLGFRGEWDYIKRQTNRRHSPRHLRSTAHYQCRCFVQTFRVAILSTSVIVEKEYFSTFHSIIHFRFVQSASTYE